jgi:hypothetical protein
MADWLERRTAGRDSLTDSLGIPRTTRNAHAPIHTRRGRSIGGIDLRYPADESSCVRAAREQRTSWRTTRSEPDAFATPVIPSAHPLFEGFFGDFDEFVDFDEFLGFDD